MLVIGASGVRAGRVQFTSLFPFQPGDFDLPLHGEQLTYRSPGVFEVDDLAFDLDLQGERRPRVRPGRRGAPRLRALPAGLPGHEPGPQPARRRVDGATVLRRASRCSSSCASISRCARWATASSCRTTSPPRSTPTSSCTWAGRWPCPSWRATSDRPTAASTSPSCAATSIWSPTSTTSPSSPPSRSPTATRPTSRSRRPTWSPTPTAPTTTCTCGSAGRCARRRSICRATTGSTATRPPSCS